jgi:hypothetical protein
MKLFVSLPDALIIDLFSEWLFTKDVAKLDSAVCSKEFRETMLEFLASDLSSFHCETSLEMVDDWTILRKLKLHNLIVSSDCGALFHDGLCKIIFSKVRKIHITTCQISDVDRIVDIINASNNLIWLTGKTLIMNQILFKIMPSILIQIQFLPIILLDQIEHVISHCTNLSKFTVAQIEFNSIGSDKICELASKNSHLQQMILCDILLFPDNLRQIKAACPHLSRLICDFVNPEIPLVAPLIKQMLCDSRVLSYRCNDSSGMVLEHGIVRSNIWVTSVRLNGESLSVLMLLFPLPKCIEILLVYGVKDLTSEIICSILDSNPGVWIIEIEKCDLIINDHLIRSHCMDKKRKIDVLVV